MRRDALRMLRRMKGAVMAPMSRFPGMRRPASPAKAVPPGTGAAAMPKTRNRDCMKHHPGLRTASKRARRPECPQASTSRRSPSRAVMRSQRTSVTSRGTSRSKSLASRHTSW